ncbi:HpcH/HpaI aldolase family protein [Pollutimonas bauzanensis]|uniref:4-hydroxy-2-oxoheptanedioate aldolase n=1 Tax=Pollutimonas bauzanensis TaxID=658167 RepID=A0A1M5X6Z9_9BURK|nr:aldolase/citrate lyase family protein [Pollutimonas bauzanensis]SHH95561.1 4-hydroxy-2-oxoheptanedioate aldolase [Pollutimonas bauzanensis]
MTDIPRLNGVIRALEQGQAAFTTFVPPELDMVRAYNAAPYDALVFELEHSPYDIRALQDTMQFMLDRRQIAASGSLAPKVTPFARIPANGSEMNQFLAKQVLDLGVYGVIWPHVSTVEEARNAVAACRYPRPSTAPAFEPAGQRGDGPKFAPGYWGLTQQEYYERADVWPLNPKGEILVGIMCEEVKAIRNLPDMLQQVPGIGVVLIGLGDLSQELGFPRQYDHPAVASAVAEILAICKVNNVACGHPHVNAGNIEQEVARGFRWLMPTPTFSFTALEKGRSAAGR